MPQEAGVRKIKSLVTQYAIDSELEPKAAYAVAHPRAEPMVVAPIGRVPDGMYISAEQPSHPSARANKTARCSGSWLAPAQARRH